MKSKSKEVEEFEEIPFDKNKYTIKEEIYPFTIKFYRLYSGDVGACILDYEKKYGEIILPIYHDKEKHIVGFISKKVEVNEE